MIQSIGSATTALTSLQRPSMRPPEPQEIFSRSDSDSDGTLTADELQAMLDEIAEKMGNEGPSAADLLEKLDTDGDGALSSAEFEAGRPEGPPPGQAYRDDGTGSQDPQRLGLNIKA